MIFNRSLDKIKAIALNFIAVMIPFFQFVPCASIWFGIMSLPLISYFLVFLRFPNIALYDINFFFGYPGTYIALLGGGYLFIFFILSINSSEGINSKGTI